jgi:hypothetical protein
VRAGGVAGARRRPSIGIQNIIKSSTFGIRFRPARVVGTT